MTSQNGRLKQAVQSVIAHHPVRWIALAALCVPSIHESLERYVNFGPAVIEMGHYGLLPPAPYAAAAIFLDMALSVMVLVGFLRWIGALALAILALTSAHIATPFWDLMPGASRTLATKTYFEHIGLFGGFLLVAWEDLRGTKP